MTYAFTEEADKAFRDKAIGLQVLDAYQGRVSRLTCPRCGRKVVVGDEFGWVPSPWTHSGWAVAHAWCWADYYDPVPTGERSRLYLHLAWLGEL